MRKVAAFGISSWIGGIFTERHLIQNDNPGSNMDKVKECLKRLTGPITVKAAKSFPPEGRGHGVVPITENDSSDSNWMSSWTQNPKEHRMNQVFLD